MVMTRERLEISKSVYAPPNSPSTVQARGLGLVKWALEQVKPTTLPSSGSFWVVRAVRMDCQSLGSWGCG